MEECAVWGREVGGSSPSTPILAHSSVVEHPAVNRSAWVRFPLGKLERRKTWVGQNFLNVFV